MKTIDFSKIQNIIASKAATDKIGRSGSSIMTSQDRVSTMNDQTSSMNS
jgi:hypothetical protein